MLTRIALISLLILPLISFGQEAKQESGVQKTTVEIQGIDMISTLKLNENIIITAQDVTNAKVDQLDKQFELGTFCTSTNNPKKYIYIIATNNEGLFEIIGHNQIGNIPYTILLNKQKLIYNQPLKFFPQGENKHIDCNTTETIQIIIAANVLAKSKAGSYDISLNMATTNLN